MTKIFIDSGYGDSDPGAVDGIFGSKIRSAVRIFQRQNNLQVERVAGHQTFQILFK
ncbi:peptidoglycan-binding protein [Bacillus sp. A301a_S52]|nr:peptidoglycan-binding protein [Bacillus sp. A301a_S52]